MSRYGVPMIGGAVKKEYLIPLLKNTSNAFGDEGDSATTFQPIDCSNYTRLRGGVVHSSRSEPNTVVIIKGDNVELFRRSSFAGIIDLDFDIDITLYREIQIYLQIDIYLRAYIKLEKLVLN